MTFACLVLVLTFSGSLRNEEKNMTHNKKNIITLKSSRNAHCYGLLTKLTRHLRPEVKDGLVHSPTQI